MADDRLIRKTSISKFYRAWVNMKTRCNNPNISYFNRYGGRGIKVCKKWQSFDGFIDDMYDSYKDNLTLDRVDNNGNYCKENCRWATSREQAQNTRNIDKAIKIKYMGIKDTIKNWAEYFGIKRRTLSARIIDYKWSIEKSLFFQNGGGF